MAGTETVKAQYDPTLAAQSGLRRARRSGPRFSEHVAVSDARLEGFSATAVLLPAPSQGTEEHPGGQSAAGSAATSDDSRRHAERVSIQVAVAPDGGAIGWPLAQEGQGCKPAATARWDLTTPVRVTNRVTLAI